MYYLLWTFSKKTVEDGITRPIFWWQTVSQAMGLHLHYVIETPKAMRSSCFIKVVTSIGWS
jgi:hypothetical protein